MKKWMKMGSIAALMVVMGIFGGSYYLNGSGDHQRVNQGKIGINGSDIPVTVKVELRDEHGVLKEVRESHNKITNIGLSDGLNRMLTTGTLVANWIALETGGCAVATLATDTALTTEVGTRLQKTTISVAATTNSVRTATIFQTFGPSNPPAPAAICGVGLFTAVTGPDMFLRTTFAVVNKATSDSLTVTINVILTST